MRATLTAALRLLAHPTRALAFGKFLAGLGLRLGW
jgi:hypothetical protein